MWGQDSRIDPADALSVFDWWRDAGVDTMIEEAPVDWLARASLPVTLDQPPPIVEPVAPAITAYPDTLDAFRAWLAEGDDVPEAGWGRTRITPSGDPASGLMIVTDAPEPGDAEAGQIFSGELGRLFDRMLAAMRRDRGSVYLAPLSSVRPPGGRIDPAAAERLAAIARHHVSLVAPKRVLVVGQAPSRALLGIDCRDARGKAQAIKVESGRVEAVATFHPKTLLQSPAAKAEAWKDLQLLMGGFE